MNWLLLIAFVVVCELVGITGSIFTVRAIPTWYARLRKPTFSPPNWLFGPAWTMLYALQGIAAYLVFHEGNGSAFALFIFQLLLNACWTPLFFGAKQIGAAFVEIIVLLIFVVVTTVSFFNVNAIAGWLMVPYAAWVAFAATLNYKIWRLNAAHDF
jgi:benzodiazapine receptor